MPEDIGHFKVIIEGEVDKKLGDSLEKGLKESSKKVSKNLEKEIDSGINLGSRKGIEKFEKNLKTFETKFKNLIKSPSFTNLFAFIDSTTEKSSTTAAPKPQEKTGKDVAEGATEGAAAGGIKGAAIGAIVSLLAKISVGILALQAVMSLGPVQAMLKMITAILQITLYPIAQFFLAIFKPILIMLLKYLILPFYYNVMPVLEKLGAFIGEGVGNIAEWIFSTFLEPIYNIIVGLFKFVTTIFSSIVSVMIAAFKVVFNLLNNLGTFIITIWTSVFKSIYSIFIFFGKLMSGLITLFFGPLIEAVADLARGPEGVPEAMNHLIEWVGGMGTRFATFGATMGTAWNDLIDDISINMNTVITTGANIFTTLATDIQNFATVALTAVAEVFVGLVEIASTMSDSTKNILLGMAEAVGNIWIGLGKTIDGILKGLGVDLGIDFDTIGLNFKEMIDKLKNMDLIQINTIFADMLEKMRKGDFGGIVDAFNDMINAFKKTVVDTVLSPIVPPSTCTMYGCSADTGKGGNCDNDYIGNEQCIGDTTGGHCYTPQDNCYTSCDTCQSDYVAGYCDKTCYNTMSTGGIVTSPTRALIGESGPEAVIPLPGFLKGSSLGDLVNQKSVNTKFDMGGMGTTITNNFNIARIEKDVDIDSIVEKIERSFYTNTKRAGIR